MPTACPDPPTASVLFVGGILIKQSWGGAEGQGRGAEAQIRRQLPSGDHQYLWRSVGTLFSVPQFPPQPLSVVSAKRETVYITQDARENGARKWVAEA